MSLKQIKEIVKTYSEAIKIEPQAYGIVSHPLFEHITVIDTETRKPTLLTPENQPRLIKQRLDLIQKSKDITRIFIYINKPYRLPILLIIQDLINKKELTKLTKWVWTSTEFPHQNKTRELTNLFKRIDANKIMTKEEKETLQQLPDLIIVYRGVWGNPPHTIRGLSWTINKDKAKWFSKRFGQKGRVFRANIPKEAVFLYTNKRDEQEIILNPNKLKNIKEMKT